jgi:hypothetical protein
MSVLALLVCSRLDAQASIRLGSEFLATSFTAGRQADAAVAVDSNGDFVVTWESLDQDGSDYGVFARRFNAAGNALGVEFQVNAYTPDRQNNPAVAFSPFGGFVIVWQSQAQDGSNFGVFARGFDETGASVGGEFQVNTFTAASQLAPAVAFDPNGGDVLVAWQSANQDGDAVGVFAQRYDPQGVPLAAEFQLNDYTVSNQAAPSIGFEADGDFVVTWVSGGQDGGGGGVFARRWSGAGVPQAAEFQVNTYTADNQGNPKLTVDGDGDFLVVWESQNQDASGNGVFGQFFRASGAAQAAEFQLSLQTVNAQVSPVAAVDHSGNFIVSWQSFLQDGADHGVFGRHFNPQGVPQATEFQINSYTQAAQRNPALAVNPEGAFVVSWWSYQQDGSGYGVFAQRFAVPAILDIDANGSTAPLTDGLLVLRYLFGFTGAPLVSGAVDLNGCTRCNATAIQGYLQTLI